MDIASRLKLFTLTAYNAFTTHTVYTAQTALEQKGYFDCTYIMAVQIQGFGTKKGMGNGMGDTKIDPANREKRNLEHQHPAIECFSAVQTSCANKEN